MSAAAPETPRPASPSEVPSRPKTPPGRSPTNRSDHPSRYALRTVISVAFLVATLFTAWTPGSDLWSAFDLLTSPAANVPLPALPAVTGTPHARPLIGVVAGHWQNDSGAICPDGLQEVDINLTIATLVQKFLIQTGFDAELLAERDPRLNDYRASALISIHADSCDYINSEATGYKVAAAQATRYPERTARLTACLVQRYGETTRLPLHLGSITEHMTRYHAFEEVDPNTPAAIIETGFMNLDRAFLTQTPELAAEGIAKGIICFIRNENLNPAAPTSTATAAP